MRITRIMPTKHANIRISTLFVNVILLLLCSKTVKCISCKQYNNFGCLKKTEKKKTLPNLIEQKLRYMLPISDTCKKFLYDFLRIQCPILPVIIL